MDVVTTDRASFDAFKAAVESLEVPWEEDGMRRAWEYLNSYEEDRPYFSDDYGLEPVAYP